MKTIRQLHEEIRELGAIMAIKQVNPTRNSDNLNRRVIKVQEECGELAEAYLGVSTKSLNHKKKKWADVREEAIDIMIVACDIALTPLPGEEKLQPGHITAQVELITAKKLLKWLKNQAKRKAATM